ncbi:hypothetical protein PoMZ_05149 [Pyricularia oryzae]|uniref:Fungal N-terminal domain-containing protein n=1 Tax=Pyricularia oryzae TaxID=318829 RepID=A0A4P7NML1_PYROR|nr:hypothetical protein PoMZ_05149 [Pyricularia oryzae]
MITIKEPSSNINHAIWICGTCRSSLGLHDGTHSAMSFGYSVGDLIAGANMTNKLIRIMSGTSGASIEYQEAMAELCAMQDAFIQISRMHRASDVRLFPQATVNAVSVIVIQSIDTIGKFLKRTKSYHKAIGRGEACGVEGSWRKVGWALFKEHELKELRDSLHTRLASVNTLLTVAKHSPLTQQETSPLASAATLVISETVPEEQFSVETETDSAQIVQIQHGSRQRPRGKEC